MSTANIIETINISHEISWQPWAVSYFFFIGIAVAAALLSLMWTLFKRSGWETAGRMSVIVMLTTVIVAPIALVADLHQPGRFWHFYTHFTSWSWMSWGSFFLPVFVVLAIIYGWICLRTHTNEGERLPAIIKPLAIMLGIAALLVALYTGEEVMVIKSRPMWHTYALPLAYLFSGFVGAAGLALLFRQLYEPNERESGRKLSNSMALFSLLTLLVIAGWLYSGSTGMSDSAQRAFTVIKDNAHWKTLGIELAIAFLLPFIFGLFFKRGWMLALVGLVGVAGVWQLRWIIFIDGQLIPKTGAGEYSYQLPMGSEGLLGIAGVFGLWIFAAIVITSFFLSNSSDKTMLGASSGIAN